MLCVDVFCPLYNASKYLKRLYNQIKSQKNIVVKNIVFGITESSDDTLDIVKRMEGNVKYFVVSKKDFSHSSVRERGMNYCTSPIVIFLSQDVDLFDENSFFNLANGIDLQTPYAYGKQISIYKGIEKYVREINYPNSSHYMSKKDINEHQIKAFFASDAFAAYDREYFIKNNGYDKKILMTNEDMYYARKVILSGKRVMYNSNAIVKHSHKYTISTLYKRYYYIGVFFRENSEFRKYKSTDSGINLALKVFLMIIKKFDIIAFFKFFPDMLARYLGKKNGEKCK